MNGHPNIERAFGLFAEVGAQAVLQELKIRILASKTPETKNEAFAFTVAVTEEAVLNHYLALKMITQEEKTLIEKARGIRNKILHCEFDEAINRIRDLKPGAASGASVGIIKIEGLKGEELLAAIFDQAKAKSEGRSDYKTIESVEKTEAGIFGWFLQAIQTGALAEARQIFQDATGIIERVISESSKSSK